MPLLAGEDKGTVLANQPAPAEEGRAQSSSRAETPLGGRPRGPRHSSRTGGASPRTSRPLHIAGKERGVPWRHEGPHGCWSLTVTAALTRLGPASSEGWPLPCRRSEETLGHRHVFIKRRTFELRRVKGSGRRPSGESSWARGRGLHFLCALEKPNILTIRCYPKLNVSFYIFLSFSSLPSFLL